MTRIAVFGAGAIGCWLGGRLAAGGADVTLIGRARVIDELAGGLRVTELGDRAQTVRPKLATEVAAAATADLVLVTVKSAATAEAGRELATGAATGTTIVSFQNGVRNAQVLRDAMPGRTVLAGMVPFNVARIGPGHYHRGTDGALMIEASPAAAPVLAACRAARLPIEERHDMPAVLWSKLVLNLNNAINALSGRPLAAQLADRDFRRCLAAAQREALDLLAAAQQPVARLLALPTRWLPYALGTPNWLFSRVSGKINAVDPLARSSMSDDFAAGRATEIDYLQGEVVALADRLGRRAPKNAALVGLVRAAERGGKRDFTGAELWRELQAAR